MKDSKYYKKRFKTRKVSSDKLSILFSQFLLAVIFVLGSLVLTNFSSEFKSKYVNEVLENNFDFSKINKFYNKYIGGDKENKEEMVVANLDNNMSYEHVGEAVKFLVDKETPVKALEGGIIVFIGDKDDLGKTIIIQGNDGVDIWYSGVTSSELKVYDYIESTTIIGITSEDYLYITLNKDGEYLNYEEYISQI